MINVKKRRLIVFLSENEDNGVAQLEDFQH